MDFFGIGTFEILTILVVATLVFGPNRIPEFAKKAGEFIRGFQNISRDMTKEFAKAIDKSPNNPGASGKSIDSANSAGSGKPSNVTNKE